MTEDLKKMEKNLKFKQEMRKYNLSLKIGNYKQIFICRF